MQWRSLVGVDEGLKDGRDVGGGLRSVYAVDRSDDGNDVSMGMFRRGRISVGVDEVYLY